MSDQSTSAPADRGLGGLGLLMQMTGGVFAAFSAMIGVVLLLAVGHAPGAGDITMWFMITTVSGVVRSLMHRKAGASLLYPSETERPFAGIRSYLVASGINTALWGYVLHSQLHAPTNAIAPFLIALMAWPLALMVVTSLPGFSELATGIPTAEDKGFEGAALLMLVLGVLGLLFTTVALYGWWEGTPSEGHSQGAFMMVVLTLIALIIRSALHVSAAVTGLRERRMDVVLAAANRYCDFGVVASFTAGGLLLLGTMMLSPDPSAFAVIACLVWALLVWPMTLRRFFGERQFADLMANTDRPSHHRAPDLGLTTLGWLLLGQALFALSFALPAVLESHHGAGELMRGPFAMLGRLAAAEAGSSPWWAVGVTALELWAAIELIRMSELHRIAASAFGAIAAAVTVYQNWDFIRLALHGRAGMADSVVFFGVLAFQLTVPLVTLFAANRGGIPPAQARYAG